MMSHYFGDYFQIKKSIYTSMKGYINMKYRDLMLSIDFVIIVVATAWFPSILAVSNSPCTNCANSLAPSQINQDINQKQLSSSKDIVNSASIPISKSQISKPEIKFCSGPHIAGYNPDGSPYYEDCNGNQYCLANVPCTSNIINKSIAPNLKIK